ncbi:hypothetical protein H0O00_05080 [Candidatus Micrarchaeota archaeon]|nr:hypothetical protein [Candidatus Micrarchaeota archaeon]
MAGAIARREIVVPKIPALAMANRFSRYKPETERAVRKVEVVEDKTLKKMKDAWKSCGYVYSDKYYPEMLETVKKLEYSAKDVEKFSIALAEFRGERASAHEFGIVLGFVHKAGFFLSALMNNCKDSEFVVHTNHLAKPIIYLGYRNTKNIIVNGNVGDYLGEYMEGGTITVEGTAGDRVGCSMEGGTIIVKGNAGDEVGYAMEGGTITVKGNAGDDVGERMNGGEIHLNGGYNGRAGFKHGKIFHKGKLIENM